MPLALQPTQILPNIVEGANHSPYLITWKDGDSSAINLTGATITARIRNSTTKVVHDSSGAFGLIDGTAGMFSWQPHVTDMTQGDYEVQFKATYEDDSYEATPLLKWKVTEFIDQAS